MIEKKIKKWNHSQNAMANKADAVRSINWRNFLRLGRNTNANIRFAGKRDGSSTSNHHSVAVPIELLIEKYAQRTVHNTNADAQDTDRSILTDDEQQLDDIDTIPDQTTFNDANDLQQN